MNDEYKKGYTLQESTLQESFNAGFYHGFLYFRDNMMVILEIIENNKNGWVDEKFNKCRDKLFEDWIKNQKN